jgi:hypothetical protein
MAESQAVSVRAQFGKPKYGAKTGHKTWRIAESKPNEVVSNIFRILPPMKSGLEDGIWAAFFAQHFGYSGVDKVDASKQKARPFACPKKENFTTKMVTVGCAECDKREAQEALLAARKAALEAEGHSEEEIDSILAPLKSWCKNHNQDRKWYINVVNQKNEFGVIAIPHKAYQKLKAVIKRLMEEDGRPDPIADYDKGVWFDFRRTGKGRNTEYDVLVVEETIDVGGGRKAKVVKDAPLTDAQLEQALKECPDLIVGALMRVVSPEQVAMLVASSGDPEEVDAILGSAQRVEASASPTKPRLSAANAAAQAVKPNMTKADADRAKAQDAIEAFNSANRKTTTAADDVAELERQLEEAKKRKLAAASKVERPAPPELDEDEDLSPEELEKLLKK